VILGYQRIVSRQTNPTDAAVITIGTIHSGDRCNVIAGKVKMEGTVRTLDSDVQLRAHSALAFAKQLERP